MMMRSLGDPGDPSEVAIGVEVLNGKAWYDDVLLPWLNDLADGIYIVRIRFVCREQWEGGDLLTPSYSWNDIAILSGSIHPADNQQSTTPIDRKIAVAIWDHLDLKDKT